MARGGSPSTRTARATRLAEPLARLARPVGGKEGLPRGRWRRSVKAARTRQCPRGFESHALRTPRPPQERQPTHPPDPEDPMTACIRLVIDSRASPYAAA